MSTKNKKDYGISIRFSQEEKEELARIASSNKLTLSEFVRQSALDTLKLSTRQTIPEVNRCLYFEMGKITEYMYINGINKEVTKNLKKLIDDIRIELIGLKEIANKEDF